MEKTTRTLRSASELQITLDDTRGRTVMPAPAVAIIGLGYVGLPLAMEVCEAGMPVTGIDQDDLRVAILREGRSYVDDVPGSRVVTALQTDRFKPTTNPEHLTEADVIIICVPTPLKESIPDLSAVVAAAEATASRLKPGALVVLESTTYPGTTEDILLPILEKGGRIVGKDFSLAFSPERIDPGNQKYDLRNTPKVVGGVTETCTHRAIEFYQKVVEQVLPVSSPRVAEMTKLIENSYRQVNIAFVNEMAIVSHELGIDLWEVIEAASSKPFGYQPFYPGPGVGGHCIPVDPNYLSYRVRAMGYSFRFVELAQEINDRMPRFVVDRLVRILNDRSLCVRGSRILLLGVTYKADIADERGAPARAIGEQLVTLGVSLRYHDPYVPHWEGTAFDLYCVTSPVDAARLADVVVLLQAHSAYDLDEISKAAEVLFDTRGRALGPNVIRL